MLHSEQVGKFLAHENPFVRDHALRSLSMAGSHAGVTADVAIDAIDRYGMEAFARAEQITDLPMSAKAMERLLALDRSDYPEISRWLQKLPQAVVQQYAPRFPKDMRDLLAYRLEFGALSAEDLWARLDPADESSAEILALVAHDEFAASRVLSILAKRDDPMRYIAVELAGLCHIGSALPMLLDWFGKDDIGSDVAIEAVARMGTSGAVTAIERRCERDDAAFRGAAAACLARIRVPSVEPTLQRMMLEEDSPSVLEDIASAMTDICTTSSFDAVCDLIRKGRINGESVERTKGGLGALSIMLGRQTKELNDWLGTRPRLHGGLAACLATTRTDAAAATSAAGDVKWAGAPAEKTSAIRREQAKVGRNDPCPCGSGKKYKKCCGT